LSLFTILMIAFGLSMDAFAVSITSGMLIKEVRIKHALKIAAIFGFFQAVMPLIGWLAGINFRNYIGKFDHWIALGLLGFIGGKMVNDSIKEKKDSCPKEEEQKDDIGNITLLLLAIATSIDALAAGVGFALLNISIMQASILIGLVTFIVCVAGVLTGKRCNVFLRSRAELIGGIVLILIGIRIFIKDTDVLALLLSYLTLHIRGL
jgi:putative Mn2+ efflux pump MntP